MAETDPISRTAVMTLLADNSTRDVAPEDMRVTTRFILGSTGSLRDLRATADGILGVAVNGTIVPMTTSPSSTAVTPASEWPITKSGVASPYSLLIPTTGVYLLTGFVQIQSAGSADTVLYLGYLRGGSYTAIVGTVQPAIAAWPGGVMNRYTATVVAPLTAGDLVQFLGTSGGGNTYMYDAAISAWRIV